MQSQDSYSQSEAARVLGSKVETLVALRRAGLLPFVMRGTRFLYDKGYIDGLRQILKLAGEKLGGAYTQLYYLRYLYTRADRQGKARILASCRELIEQEAIMRIAEFESYMADYVRPGAITKWQVRGKLAVLRVGQYRYIGKTYASRIRQLYGWESVEVAAARLYTTTTQLYDAYYRGEIEGGRTPGGLIRLKSNFTWRPSEGWIGTVEAAAQIGVSHDALKAGLRSKIVKGTRKGRLWLVSPEEIARWKLYFATISHGFEWLPEYLMRSAIEPLMPVSKVERTLLIKPQLITAWSKAGLLPFYPLSLGGRNVQRGFVAAYIRGLARYSGQLPTSKAQAREYAQACRAAAVILERSD